jgi:peptidoglycan hydrolase CwlO-like protein
MTSQQEKFQALLSDAERHERRVQKRTTLFSLIPIVLAGIFLGYTIWQIRNAQADLNSVQEALSNTEKNLNETTFEYEETQAELAEVQGELSESHAELEDADKQLGQIKADLQTANGLVAETQNQLDETTLDLETAQGKLITTQEQVVDLETQLEKLNQDIAFAEEQLQIYQEAETFKPYLCNIGPEAVKIWSSYLYANHSSTHADVFNHLIRLQLQGVKFSINGASIQDGFNSPNFAAYILKENGLSSPQYVPSKLPWEQLETIRRPGQGDIVYYKSGYTMFNFYTENQRCVIGMTPAGIVSLVPDFATIIGSLKVPYPNQ